MATTFVDYTGDGNATKQFSFASIKEADIKVEVDNVVKTSGNHYNITSYSTTGGGNVVFTSGNIPASPAAIRIYRDTDVDAAKATFVAGSSVKAGDLNNNMTQVLYAAQEEQNQTIITSNIKDGAITSAKILDGTIVGADLAEGIIDTGKLANNSVTTAKIIDANVTTAKIADSNVTTAKIADSNVTTAKIADSNVTTAKIANDAINGTKIADDSINSEHYADGSIDTAHIANSQVTTAKIADSNVTTAKIASDAITNAKIADGAISNEQLANDAVRTAHIADLNVTTAKIAADAVTNAKIADDSIDSEHYVDGSIDTAHIGNSQVTTAKIAADNITNALIADDQIDSEHYVDGSIDTAHIGGAQVTDAKLASNSVTTSKITDANVTTVKIADSNVTLAKLASDLKQTSISDSDTQLPTSGAVVDYVAAQIAPLGGLEVVATEVAFPNTQPASGVVISISDAGGVVFNGSGVSTTGRTVGGSTVTINGAPSSLYSETLAAGVGLMVSSTGSSQTYNYHKILGKESDIKQLSDDINDFAERYRVGSSNPTSSLHAGDLFFNTGSNKLLVYNATNTAWEETQTVGNFFINTISSSSGTGGGSATFNGSAYRFTISNAGTYAQQHIVSINGVVQKPNTGTSQPSEGFAIDGGDIIFSSAPASGADYFIITVGASVSIGTPSDGTVSTAKLANGAVTTAKLADANVTTAKIADDAVTAAKIADDAVVQAAIADASVDEARLQISNSPTNGYFLSAQSGNTGGLTWAQVSTDLVADTSPQLGGDLDLNGSIISVGDGGPNSNQEHIRFGNDGDLRIFHNGSNSVIQDSGTGYLLTQASGFAVQNAAGSETIMSMAENGSVDLYYDDTKRFETTSDGVQIYGLDNGESGARGDFKFKQVDGTSKIMFDASTAQFEFLDNSKATFGTGDDLQIYHDGTDNFITTSNGHLNIYGDGSNEIHIKGVYNEESIKVIPNGAVELYHDNNKVCETAAHGLKVKRTTATTSYIELVTSAGIAGYLYGNSNTDIQLMDEQGHPLFKGIKDGAAELYHNNIKKLETSISGIHLAGANSEISFVGSGTCDHSISSPSGTNDIVFQANKDAENVTSCIVFKSSGTGGGSVSEKCRINGAGHFRPGTNNTYDLGTISYRWRNVYTNDLHLSNEGSSNDVDGSWGNWTIQEGESDLFLKNNRSGKKYKFNLTEVS